MQNYNYQENLNLYSLWRVWTTTTSAPDQDLILTLSLHLNYSTYLVLKFINIGWCLDFVENFIYLLLITRLVV